MKQLVRDKIWFGISAVIAASFLLLAVSLGRHIALADDIATSTVIDINLHYAETIATSTVKNGYTMSAFDNKIKLSFASSSLASSTDVELIKINGTTTLPWEMNLLSDIYQYDIKNKSAYNSNKPLQLQIAYNKQDYNLKEILYFDNNCGCWRPLPTRDDLDKKVVSAMTTLSFARVAVFSFPKVIVQGGASWYKYKNGNFAASPDFPAGSKIKITNTDNHKSVVITVNDFGPDRLQLPSRVLDLDKVAFSKIGSLSAGTINIKIDPIYIASGSLYNNVGNMSKKFYTSPQFNVKSAVIINASTGNVLWSKNSTSTSSLASLTKLVAIKTFLDTRPTLSTVVAYSKRDEQYNYEYCQPWESAKLKINDGETLTIGDLVYTSLVGSTNNTIETLVRVSGLSRNDFIALMNKNVANWGASSTHFIEPTGLSPLNMSSPLDYAIIAREVLTNPIIQKTDTMSEYRFTTINKKTAHRIKNTNKLMELNRYRITGSKTGYLNEAGYCLMTRVEDGKNSIIVVSFGSPTFGQSLQTTNDLINYGLRKINDQVL